MGMKKKMLSATLCAVMVGSLAAPAFTVQAADDTLVYWSMWEATEPQGQVIQEVEQCYCGKRTYQDVHPHGQDEQHHHGARGVELLLTQDIRRRIA